MAAPKLNPATIERKMKLAFQPVQRGKHIAGFGFAIVRAFTQARAAKVEAQNRTAESPMPVIERLHGVVDDLVVQVAAAERVGMADSAARRIGAPRFRTLQRPGAA